jgi:transposase
MIVANLSLVSLFVLSRWLYQIKPSIEIMLSSNRAYDLEIVTKKFAVEDHEKNLTRSRTASRRSACGSDGSSPSMMVSTVSTRNSSLTTEKIESLSDEIEARAAEIPEVKLLETIPGMGALTALQIYAEIGEIERFDRAAELVSYAGVDLSVRESADSRTEGSISKQGNKYLRTAVVQGAWRAVHNEDPYLGKFYHRLRDQKNKPEKVARVAAGRKLLVSIFHILSREEVYDPPGR